MTWRRWAIRSSSHEHDTHAALACREAAQVIGALDTTAKRRLLNDMADAFASRGSIVLEANADDMRRPVEKDVQGAMLDRLKLDAPRVQVIASALREVAELPILWV